MAEPTSWWQWLLLYPTFLAALGGSIPTVWNEVKAWRLGVHSSKLQQAAEQQKLWTKNLSCLGTKPAYVIEIDAGVEVGVTLCTSGDVLLRYQLSNDSVSYTWIKYPDHKPVIEQQHSEHGDQIKVATRIAFGRTLCITLQSSLVLWILMDRETPPTCRVEYITAYDGQLLETRGSTCTKC